MFADDLRYFLEVARTGRLVTAAHDLGVSHTTVGRRINQMERSLDTRLFDRVPTGWTLTDAGRSLVSYAETVETTVLAAVDDLKSTPGRLSGTVRIATPDGFGAFVLLPGLQNLRENHPALTLQVVTATKLDLLASREFDIGVTLEKPPNRRLDVYPLADYRLSLYATEQYLKSCSEINAVVDLYDHVLIGYVDDLLDIPALRIFDSILPGHHLGIQTNNISGQWMAASAGLGIALLPEYLAETDTRLVRVLPDKVRVVRRYWAVVPRELQLLGRTRVVWAALRTVVSSAPLLEACLP